LQAPVADNIIYLNRVEKRIKSGLICTGKHS
jgi:hypothetical protein